MVSAKYKHQRHGLNRRRESFEAADLSLERKSKFVGFRHQRCRLKEKPVELSLKRQARRTRIALRLPAETASTRSASCSIRMNSARTKVAAEGLCQQQSRRFLRLASSFDPDWANNRTKTVNCSPLTKSCEEANCVLPTRFDQPPRCGFFRFFARVRHG